MKRHRTLICLLLAGIGAGYAAEMPTAFVYRGRIAHAEDQSPVTQELAVQLRLYAGVTDKTALWSGVTNIVPAADGFFQIRVSDALSPVDGSRTEGLASLLRAGKVGYVGVTLGNDSERYPRQAFVTVPRVLRAATAERGGFAGTSADTVTASSLKVRKALVLRGSNTFDVVRGDSTASFVPDQVKMNTLDARAAKEVQLMDRGHSGTIQKREFVWSESMPALPQNIVRGAGLKPSDQTFTDYKGKGGFLVVSQGAEGDTPCATFLVRGLRESETWSIPYDIPLPMTGVTRVYFYPFGGGR